MKFDEVTSQFVLTRHVIGYDLLVMRSKIWDAMKPDQQAKFRWRPTRRWASPWKSSTRRKPR